MRTPSVSPEIKAVAQAVLGCNLNASVHASTLNGVHTLQPQVAEMERLLLLASRSSAN